MDANLTPDGNPAIVQSDVQIEQIGNTDRDLGNENADDGASDDAKQTGPKGKFAGKSAEDIAKSYQELESLYGKQAQELGNMKNEFGMLRATLEQVASRQNATVEEDPDGDVLLDKKEASKLVKTELEKFKVSQRYENAWKQGERAKAEARRDNPGLFKDIDEKELDTLMYGGVQQGVLAPEVLTEPAGWSMTAWQLKGKKLGFNIGPKGAMGVNPTVTEDPSSSPSNKAPAGIKASPEWNAMWDSMGIPKDRQKVIMERSKEIGDKQRRR